MYYITDAPQGTTHRSYRHQDTIGVMDEMTPSAEPETMYTSARTPTSTSGYSHDDVRSLPMPFTDRTAAATSAPRQALIDVASVTNRCVAKRSPLEEPSQDPPSENSTSTSGKELNTIEDVRAKAGLLSTWILAPEAVRDELGRSVRDSLLFQLLHHDTKVGVSWFDRDALEDEKKKVLQHPVMRVIVLLKWQAFGFRMYCEHLFMHWLLLFTMTLSLSMGLGVAPESTYHSLFIGWLTTCSVLVIAAFATRIVVWETKVPCACITIAVLGCVGGGLQYAFEPLQDQVSWLMFGRINNILVGLSALYFCTFELRELAADI
ncbi:hypothetical protein SDRG_16513 [Saprolegnia diclina VS20]|uniref:Uncharacterized protein n=1 Tax=Saprolegnia diclina (strain VS20) TaxID=1156394 RepID=T0R7Z5_SAPDV|nr:hypothetical protein SDRG_16513 [Saprolegnia diclina VS20]EQC25617.1 hypothetical protein SDRG_16513 [Saprolegnia diclina VS20]|eukprot:XP_008620949.1 hypothetical protein SDRG_16513 [Saprolegnia diclina VS20]